MEKLSVRLEFKNGASVKNCQEVLDLIETHPMVKSVELVVHSTIRGEEKKEELKDAVL